MKRCLALVTLVLALCFSVSAQNTFTQAGVLSASGAVANGGAFENSVAQTHILTWTDVATVSACTVQLETSTDDVTYTLMTGSAAQTCTSSGFYNFSGVAAKYVRVNFTALTISGGGSVSWTYSALPAATRSSGTPYVSFCGATSGATVNCANVNPGTNAHIIGGSATLASNASVVTFAPGFTSTATFTCVGNDITTRANPVQVALTSATSVTITNTTGASDVIQWMCVGY
jgi:hypothetical protein